MFKFNPDSLYILTVPTQNGLKDEAAFICGAFFLRPIYLD